MYCPDGAGRSRFIDLPVVSVSLCLCGKTMLRQGEPHLRHCSDQESARSAQRLRRVLIVISFLEFLVLSSSSRFLFEYRPVELALADDRAERSGLKVFVHRDGDGDRIAFRLFLHHTMASLLANGSEAVLLQKSAQGRSGELFTRWHTPLRTA